ncbi:MULTISPECIES: hypothetical protein [Clostridium]|nr:MULTISPECIES: hypothetical protein [Clostridium]
MKNYFWFSKGERYEEIHIRYLVENNRIDETQIPFVVQYYPSEFRF